MVTTTVPVSAIFSCWATASSKVHPLAIDWATAPLTPAASSSVREARKMAAESGAVQQFCRCSGAQTRYQFES